ncbi:alanine racemase [Aminobacter sp. J44]|nr:alanine racemase [Aminobacter sp. J44]
MTYMTLNAGLIDEVVPSGHLTIDLKALRRNYALISRQVAPARAAGVVKANAYGLGAREVTAALLEEGCRDFFVAEFVEAVELRPALPDDARLYVLNGLQPGNEGLCARINATPVANSLQQLKRWRDTAIELRRKLPVVLQFDTGMSRLGIAPEERGSVSEILAGGDLEVRFIMSHLACADEADHPQNARQLAEMHRAASEFAGCKLCFANSGGVFLGADYHGSLVRPGIALYGGAPTFGVANPMEPVVRLDVAVVQTRKVPAGAAIGYGASFVATSEMRLATIAAGYADGLPRTLSNRGAVYFEGTRLPIVGRVSMDSIIIDVSALPEGALDLGTFVEVIGPNQTLDDVATAAGTISYEILTSLGSRYRRRYV